MTGKHDKLGRRGHEDSVARQAIGLTAAGIFAALVVVIASKGGHSARKYDADTEARLQNAIRPNMVRIAKKAVSLEAERPGAEAGAGPDVKVKMDSETGKDRIVVTENANDVYARMDVVTGVKPGTWQPDPNKVEYVEIDISWGGSSANRSVDYLAAPHAEAVDGRLVSTDEHPDGWSAGSDPIGSGYDHARDSSNPDLFVVDGIGTGNPVGTAKHIWSDTMQYNYEYIAGR